MPCADSSIWTLKDTVRFGAGLLGAFVAVSLIPTFKSEPTPADVFKAAQTKLTQQKRKCLVEKQPDFLRKVSMRDGGDAYQFAQFALSSLSGQSGDNLCSSEETFFLPSGEVSIHNACLNAQPKSVLKGGALSDKQRQTFADIETCEGLTVPMPEVVRQSVETCAQQQTGMYVEMTGGLPTMAIAVGPASRPDEQVFYSYQLSETTYNKGAGKANATSDAIETKLEGCMSQAGITGMSRRFGIIGIFPQ
ncbi:MAG: hypothetical protein PHW63_01450 [Alphaproteobacteria bacterium]|nr:hypothetical protein [Alphaproteobacteria bacterium]